MEHRLIQGDGSEIYLPFARSCIAKLKKLGLPYADQSYLVEGVSIKVRIEPGHEYIRIEGKKNSDIVILVRVVKALFPTTLGYTVYTKVFGFDPKKMVRNIAAIFNPDYTTPATLLYSGATRFGNTVDTSDYGLISSAPAYGILNKHQVWSGEILYGAVGAADGVVPYGNKLAVWSVENIADYLATPIGMRDLGYADWRYENGVWVLYILSGISLAMEWNTHFVYTARVRISWGGATTIYDSVRTNDVYHADDVSGSQWVGNDSAGWSTAVSTVSGYEIVNWPEIVTPGVLSYTIRVPSLTTPNPDEHIKSSAGATSSDATWTAPVSLVPSATNYTPEQVGVVKNYGDDFKEWAEPFGVWRRRQGFDFIAESSYVYDRKFENPRVQQFASTGVLVSTYRPDPVNGATLSWYYDIVRRDTDNGPGRENHIYQLLRVVDGIAVNDGRIIDLTKIPEIRNDPIFASVVGHDFINGDGVLEGIAPGAGGGAGAESSSSWDSVVYSNRKNIFFDNAWTTPVAPIP